MSYVLEALRRAEAERHRGQVPGIHAVTVDPAGAAAGAPGSRSGGLRRAPVLAVAGLAVAAALAAALWWRAQPSPSPSPSTSPPAESRGAASQAPAAARPPAGGVRDAAGMVRSPAPGSATPQRGPAALPPAPVDAGLSSAVPARPLSPARPGTPPPLTDLAADPAPEPAAASPKSASRPPAGPKAGSEVVVRLSALPEAVRQQIPAMNFGGSTDSPEASARMLIINGQVWREGDEVAPGLRLDRIALRSAQFSFRGQRFEVGY
jgi:general secretion pathway protein B